MSSDEQPFSDLEATLKKAASALRGAGVPFLLGGSLASWARGGPETRHDLDLMIKREDVERALAALTAAGMRADDPPEEWLVKAWDGDVLVDLIWDLEGLGEVEEVLARAEELSVHAVRMPVLDLDDVIVSKLCAFDEHELDFAGALAIARALREQVDWRDVRERTAHSPYARGFLALLEALEIVKPAPAPRAGEPRVRVVPGG
jgi:predicted nucleotidyltransferase